MSQVLALPIVIKAPDCQHCAIETSPVFGWGISWLELFFNFHVTTGFTLPIKVDGKGRSEKFLEYFSDECRLLPGILARMGRKPKMYFLLRPGNCSRLLVFGIQKCF